MLKRRLKDNIKDKLIRDGRRYKDLIKIIEITISIDNKLNKRAIKKYF